MLMENGARSQNLDFMGSLSLSSYIRRIPPLLAHEHIRYPQGPSFMRLQKPSTLQRFREAKYTVQTSLDRGWPAFVHSGGVTGFKLNLGQDIEYARYASSISTNK